MSAASAKNSRAPAISQIASRFLFWGIAWLALVAIGWAVVRYESVKVASHMSHMEPAARPDDWLLCDTTGPISPGDMVWVAGAKNDFPSRVIAVEGQELHIESGIIRVDGERMVESYSPKIDSGQHVGPIVVPRGCVYLLSDVRRLTGSSFDSRLLGPIPRYRILGRL